LNCFQLFQKAREVAQDLKLRWRNSVRIEMGDLVSDFSNPIKILAK